MAKVAFVGLGVMGYPMAGHLAAKGHTVKAYNRTVAKAESWAKEHGGEAAPTPRAAAEGTEIVLMCVGNDDDVRGVVYGDDGVFAGLGKDAVLVDHTTDSAELARELDAAAKERGVHFVDAPVSGGQAGAEKGALTVMCGGSEEAFGRVEPVLQVYGKAVTYMGAAGKGQLAKMVNQICLAGMLQAISEGLAFAERSGLDPEVVYDTISKGAAQSWQMDNRWKTMAEGTFDFGFAVNWMRKDLGICLDEAKRNGALLPVTALVDQFYAEVQRKGGGRFDTSSLVVNLRDA